MVKQCWHYKYIGQSTTTCIGSFERCATLVDCSLDTSEGEASHKYPSPGCFALARPIGAHSDGNSANQAAAANNSDDRTIILSSGCLPPMNGNDEHCDEKCLGSFRRDGSYYCCCNSTGCNNLLIPRYTPLPAPSNSADYNTTLPPFPSNKLEPDSNTNYTLLVMLIVLLFVLITVIVAAYFKRTRLKRDHSGHQRSSNSNSNHNYNSNNNNSNNTTIVDNHNRHELHHMRTNPDVLVPFRNSFGDENNHHFLYGQHETHHNDNNFTNYASRIDHNDAINRIGSNNNNTTVSHERIDLKRVKLLDIVGSGRFGTVHKATLLMPEQPASAASTTGPVNTNEGGELASGGKEINSEKEQKPTTSEIAVKIIPNNEFQSWQNELRIYSSPRTRHPNILTFLGYTESPDTNSHWLLVEYASNGSLHHYVKDNTITWQEFLSISLGIVRGLSHLHDADIAHRDFKSKNVLLRHNLTPCITDFGVASMLDVNSGGSQHEQRKKYLQVGTPRYMAPEVLECSVAFTKISFTKIDVYALSLVLWELLSRCYPLPKPRINDYDDTMMSMTYMQSHEDRQHMLAPYYSNQQTPQLTSTPPRSLSNNQHLDQQNKHLHQHFQRQLDTSTDEADEARVSLLKQQANPPNTTEEGGDRAANGVSSETAVDVSGASANGVDSSVALSDIVALERQQPPVPVYKMPFEDVVGPNPDINTMRQVVVTEKLRPPIKPQWHFYPLSKLCQAIVDGWEYDHDARISASCFVERIETLQQQLQAQKACEPLPDGQPGGQRQQGVRNQDQPQQQFEPLPPPRLAATAIMT